MRITALSPRVVGVVALTGVLVLGSRTSEAAGDPEQQCQSGRYAASAKHAGCQQKAVAKFYAGGTNAAYVKASGKCLTKYTSVWARLQAKASFTGSSCDDPRFVDNGTTITDNLTGLQWEKKTDDSTVHDKDNTYSWSVTTSAADGTAYTSFLSTLNGGACFAGQCDWRLPTLYELQTILQQPFQCFTSPCIDPIFAPTSNTDVYWTATTDAHQLGASVAWWVHFHDGLLAYNLKTASQHVRAVRGGV